MEKKTDRYALAADFCREYGKLCVKYNQFVKSDSVFKEALVLLNKIEFHFVDPFRLMIPV